MSVQLESKKNVLTVLVEDYFQVGAFERLIRQQNWRNFEPRYEQNTIKALELLERFETKGTFFVLGWIAKKNPGLIRRISEAGHEVASRGYYHRTIQNLSPEEFREDLRRSNSVLEDATGRKILGYRSAGKLRYGHDEWVLEILADEGFEYDASFMPKRGVARRDRSAHQRIIGGKELWLFPYSTLDFRLSMLPISGGNYLRQIPFTLMRHAVSGWDRSDGPFMFYFHVWELDPEQPRISAASRWNRIRQYRKLDKMEWIVEELVQGYRFTSIADHIGVGTDGPTRNVGTAAYEVRSLDDSSKEKPIDSTKPLVPITVVIPCYNEVDALPYLANLIPDLEQGFLQRNYSPHFLFVDDGSTDATVEKLRLHFGKSPNVKIVEHEVNRGVAAGIMTGIKSASTEIVCSMDCDCTYDPYQLVGMLDELRPNVDMVTASPYHKDGGVRNVPGWRLFLSRGASFLYRRVLHSKMDTYTSCFRVYRRGSMTGLELQESGFLGVAEMLGKLDLGGGKIVEYPAILEVRLFGSSKMKTARTIVGHVKLLSRLTAVRFFRKSGRIGANIPS